MDRYFVIYLISDKLQHGVGNLAESLLGPLVRGRYPDIPNAYYGIWLFAAARLICSLTLKCRKYRLHCAGDRQQPSPQERKTREHITSENISGVICSLSFPLTGSRPGRRE